MNSDGDRTVLRSAIVYSPSFPHASALIVDAGIITWVGDDDGLDGQDIGKADAIDCGGSFLSPAFFDADRTDASDLPNSMGGALCGRDPAILLTRNSDGNTVRSELSASDIGFGVRLATPTSTTDDGPVAYGSATCGDDPWRWIRDRVAAQALTTRAGLNAATRAGWRMVGSPNSGQIVPGIPARLCLWHCGPTGTHDPDERVSRWSTDPRSGTPPLPDLGAALPTLMLSIFGTQNFWQPS